jgi:hypothetical protein
MYLLLDVFSFPLINSILLQFQGFLDFTPTGWNIGGCLYWIFFTSFYFFLYGRAFYRVSLRGVNEDEITTDNFYESFSLYESILGPFQYSLTIQKGLEDALIDDIKRNI